MGGRGGGVCSEDASSSLEDGGRGHDPRSASSLSKLEKGKRKEKRKEKVPKASRRNTALQAPDVSPLSLISSSQPPEQ